MTTIGYCRVSTLDQAREGLSMEAQETSIRAYCDLYDLGEPTIIRDNGKSAATLKRPGMEHLLHLLDDPEQDIAAVVVYKIDRMFRNIVDGATTLERFRCAGVRFHSVMEKWDTATAIGEAMLNIVLVFAQLERRQTGERTKSVLRATKQSPGGTPVLDEKKRLGKLVVGRAAYGMRWKNKKLIPAPEELKVVNRIFYWKRRHLSSEAIAGRLLGEGARQRNGQPFSARMVRTILNAKYLKGYL